MRFSVDEKLFEALPTACFAVVTARGLHNSSSNLTIDKLLAENEHACQNSLEGQKVKESPFVLPYREAFRKLGINPNKYMCSIEALLTRITKGKGMPNINTAVNLGNAVSLQHKLPIGAHDIDSFVNDEISIRLANADDTFVPFGATELEAVDFDEMVYVSGTTVRTRRWTWRQSEAGKIVESTKNIFFPIDGFSNFNKNEMLAAQAELAQLLQDELDCKVGLGWVDQENPEFVEN